MNGRDFILPAVGYAAISAAVVATAVYVAAALGPVAAETLPANLGQLLC